MKFGKLALLSGIGISTAMFSLAALAAPKATPSQGEKQQRAAFVAQQSAATAPRTVVGAIVAPLPYMTSGDNTGYPNLFVDEGCTEYLQTYGPEAIYTITPGSDANLQFTLTSTNGVYDPAIYLLAVQDDVDSCLAGSDDQPSVFAPSINYAAFTPGQTYYFYVDSYYDSDFGVGNPGQDFGPYNLAVSGTFPVELTEFSID